MWYEMRVLKGGTGSTFCAEVTVPAGSPWFAGHFPGQPVLPGIAQLEMVQELIQRQTGQPVVLVRVKRVRFRKIIAPGDCLIVEALAKPGQQGDYAFRIIRDQEPVATGTLVVRVGAGSDFAGNRIISQGEKDQCQSHKSRGPGKPIK